MDASLWLAFKQEGTEMIITKAGRRMFPFVMVKLEGLCPTLLYSVHLSLVPCDDRQYKFCQRRWVQVSDTTTGPTIIPEQSYTHPASPNRGLFWCQDLVSFAKLKITNNKHSQGDIVLQSMRKYMAQITVREDLGETQYVFPLPETTFVAVTQYQNEAVTRMKIAHNPFANGFKSEEGKKLYSRADLSSRRATFDGSRNQDFKQKTNTSKTSAKTARAKCTVTPQSLTPLLLNPPPPSSHGPEDLRLLGPPVPFPSSLMQPFPFSPALALEAEAGQGTCLSMGHILPGGYSFPVSTSVSPYVCRAESFASHFREDSKLNADHELGSYHAEACSDSEQGSRDSPDGILEEDQEDATETIPDSGSPVPAGVTTYRPTITIATASGGNNGTVGVTTTTLSASVTNSNDDDPTVPETSESTVLGNDVMKDFTRTSPAQDNSSPRVLTATSVRGARSSPKEGSQASPGIGAAATGSADSSPQAVPTNLSKKSQGGGLFKHPLLPKRGSLAGRKGERKSGGGAEDEASAVGLLGVSDDAAAAALADSSAAGVWGRASRRPIGQRTGEWSVKQDRGVQLKLHDRHTWASFASCGSTMTMSAEGRPMFPVLSISLRGLDPGRLYSVWLHVTTQDADVTSAEHARGGDQSTLWGSPLFGGASSRRLSAAATSVKPYMHPCSPMRGLAWMKVKVNFSEVKLTPTALTPNTSPDSINRALRDGLSLQCGRRYLTQIVVREEEELTPSGSGGMGNIYFFPLPEVTFVTRLEDSEGVEGRAAPFPVPTTLDNFLFEPMKRSRGDTDSIIDVEAEDSDGEGSDVSDLTQPSPSKIPRAEPDCGDGGVGGVGQWMRSPVTLPRQAADLSPLLAGHSDLSPRLSRHQSDLCGRVNPGLYCFPPMSALPPAHLGLLANRMSLPVSSALQPVTSFPFPASLFPQMRTPMHSAFGMPPLSSLNPFPSFYYPYSLPPVSSLASSSEFVAPDNGKVLDLSVNASAKST